MKFFKSSLNVICVLAMLGFGFVESNAQTFKSVDDCRLILEQELAMFPPVIKVEVRGLPAYTPPSVNKQGTQTNSNVISRDSDFYTKYLDLIRRGIGLESPIAISTAMTEAESRLLQRNPQANAVIDDLRNKVTQLLLL